MSKVQDISKQALQDIIWYLEEEYDSYYNEDMADESRRDFRDYTKALKWSLHVLARLMAEVEYWELKGNEVWNERVKQAKQQLEYLRELED